jgi:hypothetical protein
MGFWHGKYRVRTWLRTHTPYLISDRIPKGQKDCGNHVWYRSDESTYRCYHCVVGKRAVEPAPERVSGYAMHAELPGS